MYLAMTQYKQILANGLWRENPGLIQFLGICPLLAVSNSLVNGLGLGLATIAVLMASNLLISLIRGWVAQDIRLPVFVLVIATFVTIVELIAQAWFYDLWLSLGIFIPLIVTNCVILARAESFASRQSPLAALLDGLAHGMGFALVLAALGGLREIVGTGGLLQGSGMLFDTAGNGLRLFGDGQGFLLALLPPGAFLGLALMIALRNTIVIRRGRSTAPESEAETGQTAL
jgi:electron transport complex protein RnfE